MTNTLFAQLKGNNIMYRVIEGPCGLGNSFGYYHDGLLPAGRFAVVSDGEYANGGSGPSTVDGKSYRTREGAERALARLMEPKST